MSAPWIALLAALAAKATLVLMLTAAASALLWRASAATRHLVWCVGVAGVLALPVLTAVVPAWRVPLLPARASEAPSITSSVAAPSIAPASASSQSISVDAASSVSVDASTSKPWTRDRIAAAVLAAGVAVGALWLLVGFWGAARIGRSAQVVRDPEWLRTAQEAAEGLGLRRPVLLLRSRGAAMPATWGLLWPSVVLPASADEWPGERRHAVLAHELAHVKRFDCLTQALAQLACVLLWWHPAVWYAARRLRVERERACDDLVLAAGARASDYAMHLLEIARAHKAQWMAAPALVSMAKPSQLESRLLSVLDGARSRNAPSVALRLAVAAACLLVVAPLAAMRAVPAEASTALAGADKPAARIPFSFGAKKDRAGDRSGKSKDGARQSELSTAVRMGVAPADRKAGGDTLPRQQRTIDDLIALRAVGVDADYVAEMRRAGYTGLTDQQLISLKANNVTEQYAAEMARAFGGRIDADELVGLHAVGVSPAYLADLRGRGITGLSASDAQSMAAVGVTGEYVDAMTRAGVGRLSARDLTAMRAVGVTPDYVAAMRRAGVSVGDARELQSMRAVGVTPEYVAAMKALGLDGLDARTLTSMHAVGVTPEYVRELAGAGLANVPTHDLVSLRANGVTGAWVREMRANGLAVSSVDQAIRLRVSGLDRELVNGRTREKASARP